MCIYAWGPHTGKDGKQSLIRIFLIDGKDGKQVLYAYFLIDGAFNFGLSTSIHMMPPHRQGW